MKRLVLICGILVLLCPGCGKKGKAPELPNAGDVESISITTIEGAEIRYSETKMIQDILECLSEAKKTKEQSVQDFPVNQEYGRIDIANNGGTTTVFYYEEKGKHYIEQPYEGIYETEKNFEDVIETKE